MKRLKFKSPGREIDGESEMDRARRITSEASIQREYGRAFAQGFGADPDHVSKAMNALSALYMSGDWINGGKPDNDPFWADLARHARRVTRSADAIRARARVAKLEARAREAGMVK